MKNNSLYFTRRRVFRRQWIIMLIMLSFLSGYSQTVTIGTGTSSNSATGYPAIFSNYYYGNKIQILYEASEIISGGATANSYINNISFNVANLNSVPILDNFTIKVYTTSKADPLSSTNFFSGANASISAGPYTTLNGWNTFTFTSPILWNGCDNIVVEICAQNSNWTSNGNAATYYTTQTGTKTYVRYLREDNTTVCSSSSGPDTSMNRPNVRLGLTANTANCGYVCNFSATASSATDINLSWTGTGTSYSIEYGLTGFTLGTGTTLTTTNLTQALSSLTANTTYDIYIKQICSSGPSGGFYGPVKVKTLCGITGNFFEGFETTPTGSYSMGSLPDCWTMVYTLSNTWSYTTGSNNTSKTGSNSLEIYRDTGTGDFLVISPQTDNLGNGTKQIRFSVYLDYFFPNGPEINIYRMNGTTATSTKTLIQKITPSITNTGWQDFTIPLPATTDDYFAFSFPEIASSGMPIFT